jgi:hypothetical protein
LPFFSVRFYGASSLASMALRRCRLRVSCRSSYWLGPAIRLFVVHVVGAPAPTVRRSRVWLWGSMQGVCWAVAMWVLRTCARLSARLSFGLGVVGCCFCGFVLCRVCPSFRGFCCAMGIVLPVGGGCPGASVRCPCSVCASSLWICCGCVGVSVYLGRCCACPC